MAALYTHLHLLEVISDQLTVKYGKVFAEACRSNELGKVNPKLLQKLGVVVLPKMLVERCVNR